MATAQMKHVAVFGFAVKNYYFSLVHELVSLGKPSVLK